MTKKIKEKIGQEIRKSPVTKNLIFWTCLIASIGLFIGGFFVPPMGVIDGSVITACGILFGFASLGQIPVIIETAEHAKITKGDMTIEINGDNE
jgi:hypothetical protein